MNAAPVAAATASAARASLRSTFTPTGSDTERPSSQTTRAIAATVSAGTRFLKNGLSPKFSTTSPSAPPSARARASKSAASITSSSDPPKSGAPGSARRCTIPKIARVAKRAANASRVSTRYSLREKRRHRGRQRLQRRAVGQLAHDLPRHERGDAAGLLDHLPVHRPQRREQRRLRVGAARRRRVQERYRLADELPRRDEPVEHVFQHAGNAIGISGGGKQNP